MNESLIDEIGFDKYNLLNKYSLTCNDDMIWEFNHSKYYTTKYFSHKFVKKHSTLALLFNIHKLCYAKIKYFESNLHKYDFYKYDIIDGFKQCDWYDMSFLFHKASGIFIDIRNLYDIKSVDEFREFCNYLESFEK